MFKFNKHFIVEYLNALIHGLIAVQDQYPYTKKYTPCLISFNVGDLLRCKCSSKETQIFALHDELKLRDSGDFKIIRIKNKLKKETKDILINLLYRNLVVVEVQLAIK